MPEVLPKLRRIAAAVPDRTLVEIDGGIDPATIGSAARFGATVFVAGNAIFGTPDPAAAADRLRELASA
jgi:ribulose-phosphate 3-epimerase